MSEPAWVPLSGIPAVGPVPACRVRRSTNQSIPNNTNTAQVFDTEVFDTDGIWDVASPTRLTCKTAGKYLILGATLYAGSTGGNYRAASIRLNGASVIANTHFQFASAASPAEGIASTIIDLAAGDYVELMLYQDSGVALDSQQSGSYVPWFAMARIDIFSGAPVAGPGFPTLVTSLPASPYDGQEIILTDSLTAPTYTWHLKYVAAKASNRWVFVGGSPRLVEVVASGSTSSTTYAALPSAGPSFTVPVAGDYRVAVGCYVDNATGAVMRMSYDIGATGAVDGDGVVVVTTGAQGQSGYREQVKALAAATALVAKYKTNTGTANFANRSLSVTPIAIGG